MLHRLVVIFFLTLLVIPTVHAEQMSPELKRCINKVLKSAVNMTEREIESKKIAQGENWDKKEFRRIMHKAAPSDRDKHSKSKNAEDAKKLSSGKGGEAQYLPGIDPVKLEKDALVNKDGFYRSFDSETGDNGGKGSTFYKYVKFDKTVGYEGGKETQWIRVEWSSGTFHGHPISLSRVKDQCPECLK